MADFVMPSLGADMEAATLVHWMVAAGDTVKRGQVVAEVETDKGVLEVEVFTSGVVEELVAKEGEKLKVGSLLARIRGDADTATPSPPKSAPPAVPVAPVAPLPSSRQAAAAPSAAAATPPPAAAGPAPRPRRSSPAARVLAETSGLDIATIDGSGPGGAVTVEDVKRAIAAAQGAAQATAQGAAIATAKGAAPAAAAATPAAPPSAGPAATVSREEAQRAAMRASIAALMARSKREIPHYYLSTEIDMSRAKAWLEKENLARPVTERLLPAALLVRAVATAVAEVPEMNGLFTGGVFSPSAAVHVGVAISLRGGGLVAPAILDVESMDVTAVMASLRDLVARARSGRLRASEMSSSTITVTNLGEQGVDSVFGVIYPPQVALVGFGRIRERPIGMPGARPTLVATLAADHRVSDGHRGALFLAAIERVLESPEVPPR